MRWKKSSSWSTLVKADNKKMTFSLPPLQSASLVRQSGQGRLLLNPEQIHGTERVRVLGFEYLPAI